MLMQISSNDFCVLVSLLTFSVGVGLPDVQGGKPHLGAEADQEEDEGGVAPPRVQRRRVPNQGREEKTQGQCATDVHLLPTGDDVKSRIPPL